MYNNYTDEKNVSTLVSLLKEHNISKVIASPGTKNMTLVVSMENDSFFEMYSSVDERSAAYMACGLAAESGEPVVLSCTGATASRNYLPGLTEAFYRKLPVLAITSDLIPHKLGHNIAQVIDRSSLPKDTAKLSVSLPIVKDEDDLWDCEIKANKAILELKHHGGGPVHINLHTTLSKSYTTKELPKVRKINRFTSLDELPELPKVKIAIFLGSHITMNEELTKIIDKFCESNNAVVFCDHTSGYKGKYRIQFALVAGQLKGDISKITPDLLIHIGEVSGDYYSLNLRGGQVWRVSQDGELKDTFKKLKNVFEMPEDYFFRYYTDKNLEGKVSSYLAECKSRLFEIHNKIPDLPFSNIWIASKIAQNIPDKSTIHFGILNSLRSWNFFDLPHSVTSSSNVGGFGIDGNSSSLIGASLANKNKLYFGIIGDLAFFYDLNSLGNRHVGKNLRILMVNNGKGTEFKQFTHVASKHGDRADTHVAAAGHFGNKSRSLVKNFSTDIGFEYISASNKEEFDKNYEHFLTPNITDRPMLFEVFTDNEKESEALEILLNIDESIKGKAKELLGDNGLKFINKLRK